MTKLDYYWKSNKEWYERKGFDYKIKDDAPQEAKDSFEHYKKQLKEAEKRGAV